MSLDQWIKENQPDVWKDLQAFRKRCNSALTVPSVAASLPGLARHIESPDTLSTDEQTDQSNTPTDSECEVSTSGGPLGSRTDVYPL